VIVDIAPARNSPTLLAYVRAMRAVDLHNVSRRGEIGDRLAGTISDPAERAFLLQNFLINDGHARWRGHLDALQRAFSGTHCFPDPPSDSAFEGPKLFVAGTRSDYIRPEHEPEIQRLFPQARLIRIEGAGHWVHAEQPEAFLRAVGPFLSGAA